jgi:hypothetical protein
MSEQLSNHPRHVNFTRFATQLREFAARQEAKAPGRMDHITGPALAAAAVAERVASAYLAGDDEAAKTARAEYVAIIAANPMLNGVAA